MKYDLAAEKLAAQTEIDAQAETCRNQVVTPGSGQAMTYIRKAEAARRYIAGESLDAPSLKRITDEADRLGVSDLEAAQSLVGIAEAWELLDAEIDNIRLTAKQQIENAGSKTAINAILAAIIWPV